MPFLVTSYECAFCGKLYKTKHRCLTHEKTCLTNPLSKNCIKCIHSFSIVNKDKGYKGSEYKEYYCKKIADDELNAPKHCLVLDALTCEHYNDSISI